MTTTIVPREVTIGARAPVNTANASRPYAVQDPDAKLDYSWNWTAWLAAESSDEIVTAEVITSGTLVADEPVVDGGVVTCFLSGGTLGETETATCRVTTTGGRTDDRTLYLRIRAQ